MSLSRIFHWQWSLRTLLVVTTLAAAAVAVVTRWPFEVVEPRREVLWQESASALSDKLGNVSCDQERATYRGLLAQYRLRHGKSELFVRNPYSPERPRVVERNYRNGVLHGEYREYYAQTLGKQLRTQGEYRAGGKQGCWLNYLPEHGHAADNDYLLTQHWAAGRPHGLWQWENGYGEVSLTARYEQGRVVQVNGENVIDWQDHVRRLLAPRLLDAEWTRKFPAPGEPNGMDRPITAGQWGSLADYVEPQVPLRKVDDEYYPRVSRVPREVQLAHALQVAGLAFTVRHNCVFLTTPDRIGPEHDPTGVSQLAIDDESQLGKALAAEIDFNRWQTGQLNFRQALDFLRQRCQVPIDDSPLRNTLAARDEDRPWIRLADTNSNLQRVRDLLGLALFHARCHCEVVEGQLVISRQP